MSRIPQYRLILPPDCAHDLTGKSGLSRGWLGKGLVLRGRAPYQSVILAGPPIGSQASENMCVGWGCVLVLAPHTISAVCPSAVCTAERGSRVGAENPRVLGLASKGIRSRCCHGEKGENGSGNGLV